MATGRRIANSTSSASLPADWGLGGAVASSDTLYVAYDCDLTTNLGVMASVALTLLQVENGVVMNAGVVGTTAWEVDATRFVYLGSGSALRMDGDYTTIEWSPLASTQLVLVGGSVGTLIVTSGTVEVGALCDFGAGELTVTGGNVRVLAKAGDVIASWVCTGGTLLLQRDWTAGRIGGRGKVTVDCAGITCGDIDLDGAAGEATLVWLDGNLGTVTGRSGVFDMSRLRTGGSTVTLVDYATLTEKPAVGTSLPTITRTSKGRGSRKG